MSEDFPLVPKVVRMLNVLYAIQRLLLFYSTHVSANRFKPVQTTYPYNECLFRVRHKAAFTLQLITLLFVLTCRLHTIWLFFPPPILKKIPAYDCLRLCPKELNSDIYWIVEKCVVFPLHVMYYQPWRVEEKLDKLWPPVDNHQRSSNVQNRSVINVAM